MNPFPWSRLFMHMKRVKIFFCFYTSTIFASLGRFAPRPLENSFRTVLFAVPQTEPVVLFFLFSPPLATFCFTAEIIYTVHGISRGLILIMAYAHNINRGDSCIRDYWGREMCFFPISNKAFRSMFLILIYQINRIFLPVFTSINLNLRIFDP